MPLELDPDAFDALVDTALDTIPDEIAQLVRNVVVLVEDEPPETEPADTLGLYDGIALTQRTWMPGVDLPDRIFIFRNPLLDFCDTEQQLADEVRITVVHEVAHHFGMDHDLLEELGYG